MKTACRDGEKNSHKILWNFCLRKPLWNLFGIAERWLVNKKATLKKIGLIKCWWAPFLQRLITRNTSKLVFHWHLEAVNMKLNFPNSDTVHRPEFSTPSISAALLPSMAILKTTFTFIMNISWSGNEFLLNHLAHKRWSPYENSNSIELWTLFFKESINSSFRTFVSLVLRKELD